MAKEKIIRLLCIVEYVLLLVSYMIIIFMGIVSKYVCMCFLSLLFSAVLSKNALRHKPVNQQTNPNNLTACLVSLYIVQMEVQQTLMFKNEISCVFRYCYIKLFMAVFWFCVVYVNEMFVGYCLFEFALIFIIFSISLLLQLYSFLQLLF